MPSKKKSPYQNIGSERYSYEEIAPLINSDERIQLGEDSVKINSLRLKTFARSNVCVKCGLKGNVFAKCRHGGEKGSGAWHINLYSEPVKGKGLVLFTKDHILARSEGGKDTIDNMQTMCETCNSAKGSMDNDLFMKIPIELVNELKSYQDRMNTVFGLLCNAMKLRDKTNDNFSAHFENKPEQLNEILLELIKKNMAFYEKSSNIPSDETSFSLIKNAMMDSFLKLSKDN